MNAHLPQLPDTDAEDARNGFERSTAEAISSFGDGRSSSSSSSSSSRKYYQQRVGFFVGELISGMRWDTWDGMGWGKRREIHTTALTVVYLV